MPRLRSVRNGAFNRQKGSLRRRQSKSPTIWSSLSGSQAIDWGVYHKLKKECKVHLFERAYFKTSGAKHFGPVI